MRVEPLQTTTYTPPGARPGAVRAAVPPSPVTRGAEDVVVDIAVPASPPAEVREAVDRAAEIAEHLRSTNRELHFVKDPGSSRVIVQVRDLEGNVIRTIPPSDALRRLAPGRF